MRLSLIGVLLALALQPDIAIPRDPYEINTLCTPYPVNIGKRLTVSTGADLQRALDTAVGGDTIVLTPGVTYRPTAPEGSFMLRDRGLRPGQWVIIRSASPAFDQSGALPPNVRVDKANAGEMPKLRAIANNAPAIRTASHARGYRLVGLDVGGDQSLTQVTNLVDFGSSETTIDAQPSDIVIDRCYLHGNDVGNYRRAVAMNGSRLSVIESYIENFHDVNTDSQALGGWQGPGPIKIVDNFLEAASETILFGGGDPAVRNLVTRDIEVRRNYATKRLSWRTAGVPVKNAFELKNASRVLVDGNVFEHVWASGQDGTAIWLKSANQDGACTWCVTEYVTFRNNIVRGAAMGITINAAESGIPNVPLPRPVNHIRVDNILFDDIGGPEWMGGKLLRVFGGASDVSFTHITSRSNPMGIIDGDAANPRMVFKYNIVERKYYGIGSGINEGEKTLAINFPSYSYDQNVIVNTSAGTDQAIGDGALESRYPSKTWVVGSWDAVGFSAESAALTSRSRFHKAGSDGKDIGIDMTALNAALNGPGGSAACTSEPGRRVSLLVPGAR